MSRDSSLQMKCLTHWQTRSLDPTAWNLLTLCLGPTKQNHWTRWGADTPLETFSFRLPNPQVYSLAGQLAPAVRGAPEQGCRQRHGGSGSGPFLRVLLTCTAQQRTLPKASELMIKEEKGPCESLYLSMDEESRDPAKADWGVVTGCVAWQLNLSWEK